MYLDDIRYDSIDFPDTYHREAGDALAPARQDAAEDYEEKLLGLILASDLFSALGPGPRRWQENHALTLGCPGVEVIFHGERLDQDDLDLFLGAIVLAFRNPLKSLGSTRFGLRELARLVRPKGRRFTSPRLEKSLWRLSAARIEIIDGSCHAYLRLIHSLLLDRRRAICGVEIDQRIMQGIGNATAAERLLATRIPLVSRPLARFLTSLLWYASSELLLDVEHLRQLAGLEHQPAPTFRARALAALEALAKLGHVESFRADAQGRLVIANRIARREEAACLLLT